jgi:MSHA biogenesis protein MshP
MMPYSTHSPASRRAGGAGLVTAIFLLVVLAGLATALVSIFGIQRQSTALDEQGARAYQAARSGIEWGLFQRATGASCNGSFRLPADSALASFVVTVACVQTDGSAFSEATTRLDRWRIVATACTTAGNACPAPSNSPDYVERVIEVQL